jgi:hypothetical protein
MRTTFIATGVLGIVAAAVASQLLYEAFLVPRLETVVAVPLHWLLGVGAPVIIAVLACGWFAKSWRETLSVAALSAGALQAAVHVAAWSGRPGWHKSFAIEAPLYHWTVGVLPVLALLSAVVVLGRAAHAALNHTKAS